MQSVMRKPEWILFSFLFTFLPALAAPVVGQEITPSEIKAYQNVISLKKYGRGSDDIRPAFDAYLDSYSRFLEVMIDGTPATYDAFEKSADRALSTITAEDEINLYLKSEIGIQKAFVKLKEGSELSAVWQLRQTYRDVAEYTEKYPDFLPFKRTWGLLQILVGAVPDNFQWLPRLFGVSGSIEEGRDLLLSIPSGHWLYSESRVIISLADSYLLEESKRAVRGFGEVIKDNQDNPLFSYLYMTLLLRNHLAQQAIDYFSSRKTHIDLAYYLAGNACLQAGKYAESIKWFEQFERTYEGQDFRKDTAYKLFLANYLNGNAQMADSQFKRIREVGGTGTESDRYAARMFEKGYPNPEIMRIRLATDGGFYKKAETIANSLKAEGFSKTEDQVEFIYRKARIFHFTNRPDEAIDAYRETISRQGNESWYYAPNSCLQLGYLYLDKGESSLAQQYFRKTFNYRGYEYKKGIDRKAHSALVTHF